MRKITVENEDGKIVACLYQESNGNLHADSWMCNEGWGSVAKLDYLKAFNVAIRFIQDKGLYEEYKKLK